MKHCVFDVNHSCQLLAKLDPTPSLEHEYDCSFSQRSIQKFNIELLLDEKNTSHDLARSYLRLNKVNLPSNFSHDERQRSPQQDLKQRFYEEVSKAMGELFLLSALTSNLSTGMNYGLMDVFHTDAVEKRSIHLTQSLSLVTSFYVRAQTKLSNKAKRFLQRISLLRRKFGVIARNTSLRTNNMQWELLMTAQASSSEVRGRRYESARDKPAVDCCYLSNHFLLGTSLNKLDSSQFLVPLNIDVTSNLSRSPGKAQLRTLKFSLLSDNGQLVCSTCLWRFFHSNEDLNHVALVLDSLSAQIVSHRHTSLCHLFFQFIISETASESFPIVAHVESALNKASHYPSVPSFLSSVFHQQKIFKVGLINRVERNELIILQCGEDLFLKFELIPMEDMEEFSATKEILRDLPSILLQKCIVFSLNAFFNKIVASIPPKICPLHHSRNRMKHQEHPFMLDFLNGLTYLLRSECLRQRVYFSLNECKKILSSVCSERETAVITRRMDSSKYIFTSFFFKFSFPSKDFCLETYYSDNSLTQLKVISLDRLRVYLPRKERNIIVENESQLMRILQEICA